MGGAGSPTVEIQNQRGSEGPEHEPEQEPDKGLRTDEMHQEPDLLPFMSQRYIHI